LLKLEDKILLTIGEIFLLMVLIFIGLSSLLFNSINAADEDQFYEQVDLHKEDMKKQNKDFDHAVRNFQMQFNKAQESFGREKP